MSILCNINMKIRCSLYKKFVKISGETEIISEVYSFGINIGFDKINGCVYTKLLSVGMSHSRNESDGRNWWVKKFVIIELNCRIILKINAAYVKIKVHIWLIDGYLIDVRYWYRFWGQRNDEEKQAKDGCICVYKWDYCVSFNWNARGSAGKVCA